MAVVPEPGTCRIYYELPSQRACGPTTSAEPAGTESKPTRLGSPKKRSRQHERRRQQVFPTAPGLWRRLDSGGGSSGGGGGGDSGGGGSGRAEWRILNNKENIDPRTGRLTQHPFTPFSPSSASLLVGGPAMTATNPALSGGGGGGVASGRTSSIQKRLFCGSVCGEGGQVRLRPAAAISRKPFGEPLRELWSSCSSRCSG
eukprot:g12803.t1